MPSINPTIGNLFKPTKPIDSGTYSDPGLTFNLFNETLFLNNPTNPAVNTLFSTLSSTEISSQFTSKTDVYASGIFELNNTTKLLLKNPTNAEGDIPSTFKGLTEASAIQSQFWPMYFGTGVESVDMELKNLSLNFKSNIIKKSNILSYISNMGNLPKNVSHASNIIIDTELDPNSYWGKGAALVGLNLGGTGTSQYATLNLSQLYNNNNSGGLTDFRARYRSNMQKLLDVDFDKLNLKPTSTLLLKHGESSEQRNGGKYYSEYTNDKAGVYKHFNLNDTFGFGEQGLPGRRIRQDFTRISNIHSEGDKNYNFRGDRITAAVPGIANYYYGINRGTKNDERDLIKFFFTGPDVTTNGGSDNVMIFRAIITSLSDSHNPNWTAQQMIGRADPNYHYTGYSRELSLDFTVYASDRDEMKPIWQKLNMLAGYTTPSYGEVAPVGPWMRITIGDLFVQQPAVINSLSYTLHDSDTTWEINIEQDQWMNQLPHKVSVSIGFNLITDNLPQLGGRFYTLNQDSTYDWLTN